eukprot:TRINITY_DN3747_c0_g1_i1.p1 TRINITY_DN3747_c0_g1~~TRINITY_DN3747_c0_g1_i1.p1  ORF type:complete len:553 (+),score=71.14 TRINITY_DN3747_c0_g1_i1:94-1752(+)
MRWFKPNTTGRKPARRYFHTLVAFGDRAVIVFGGKDDERRFNDCFVFNRDPKCCAWSQLHPAGTPPEPRSAHTMNAVGYRLFVFGGHRDGEKFNDLHVLDTKLLQWTNLVVSSPVPQKRNAHTVTTVGTKLYLFGGFDGESCNDLWVFDTDTLRWTEQQPRGLPPPRRCCHTTTLVGDRQLWVFGGKDNDSDGVLERFNDLYTYDTRENVWHHVNSLIKGTPPSRRNAHVAVAHESQLIVFGGFDGESRNDLFSFDTVTLTWTEIDCYSSTPAARYCHAACYWPCGSGHAAQMLVFGGCDADRNFADIQLLDLDEVGESGRDSELERLRQQNTALSERVHALELALQSQDGADALLEALRATDDACGYATEASGAQSHKERKEKKEKKKRKHKQRGDAFLNNIMYNTINNICISALPATQAGMQGAPTVRTERITAGTSPPLDEEDDEDIDDGFNIQAQGGPGQNFNTQIHRYGIAVAPPPTATGKALLTPLRLGAIGAEHHAGAAVTVPARLQDLGSTSSPHSLPSASATNVVGGLFPPIRSDRSAFPTPH